MAVFTVADYAALSTGRIDLSEGERTRFVFTKPSGFLPGTNLARPVLFYEVTPNGSTLLNLFAGLDPGNGVNLGGNSFVVQNEIGTGDNDDEQRRTLHQIFDLNPHFSAPVTAIDFEVVRGQVRLADVVLFYQLRVDTEAT